MTDRAALSRLAEFRARLGRRFSSYGVAGHVLGLLVRPCFQKAGILIVRGGWPLPAVDNRGGRIEVGNIGLFSGVRLECWPGARISIGTGTYLNRNTEIVAATFNMDVEICNTLVPDGNQRALITSLVKIPEENLLLVGHEPHLSQLISLLISGNSEGQIELKKGGLCKLASDHLIFGRSATLEWLLQPSQLRQMGQRGQTGRNR